MRLFAVMTVESADDLRVSFGQCNSRLFDDFLPAVTNQLFIFLLQLLHVGFLERNSGFLYLSDVHVADRTLIVKSQTRNRVRHFIWSVTAPSCESAHPSFELWSKICKEQAPWFPTGSRKVVSGGIAVNARDATPDHICTSCNGNNRWWTFLRVWTSVSCRDYSGGAFIKVLGFSCAAPPQPSTSRAASNTFRQRG